MSLIVHLSTVHPRTDTRIRLKETRSLAHALTDRVLLVVADGLGPAEASATGDVAVHDLGMLPRRRLRRAILGSWLAFRAIRRLRAGVVHFHDPELLPLGFALRLLGVQVVYDVHEDFSKVALSRRGGPLVVRTMLARGMHLLEWGASRSFDMVVPATPSIARRFPRENTVLVQNFPVTAELRTPHATPISERPPAVAFVGYLSRERAAVEMVQAFGLLGQTVARLELAGEFSPPGLLELVKADRGWEHVTFHGLVNRTAMAQLLARVRAGLVLFHPLPNHVDAQPNKMFEYMSAGVPVIASDFPLWRQIIDGAGCGLLVDPENPQAIADAVRWIVEHPAEAEEMGRRGREAVERTYNWNVEGARLVEAYQRILRCRGRVP